jgi:hypothetical protein
LVFLYVNISYRGTYVAFFAHNLTERRMARLLLLHSGPLELRAKTTGEFAMAFYKNSQFLTPSNHAAFDQLHDPGVATPFSGIYRCEGCGHEATSVQEHPLPPQNHHQHNYTQGKIRWRLIVADQGKPS